MGSFSNTANVFAQTSDPGGVGPGAIWARTDTGETFRRNDNNTGWVALGFNIGDIMPFPGDEADIPGGFLLCDGSAVSRTTYSLLFNLVGERFGAGDTTTTFNLPDTQSANRFLRGASADANIGDTGGVDTVTLTDSQIPAHHHPMNPTVYGEGQSNMGLDEGTPANAGRNWVYGGTVIGGNAFTLETADNTGGGSSHENKPPYLDVHYIIFAGV